MLSTDNRDMSEVEKELRARITALQDHVRMLEKAIELVFETGEAGPDFESFYDQQRYFSEQQEKNNARNGNQETDSSDRNAHLGASERMRSYNHDFSPITGARLDGRSPRKA